MLKRLFELFKFGNTLYYAGCLTKFAAPELEENYKKILVKLGIDFITTPEFNCCGSPVLNAGYEKDFKQLVNKNREIFNKYSIKRIITNCPACYNILKEEYSINVEHISQTLFRKLRKIKPIYKGEITYHDPCHLGRYADIYNEPRKVLEKLGFRVVEMEDTKEKALCCGGGAGLKTNYPELANKIAKKRIGQCKTKKLVTVCPLCYKHLKENAKGTDVFELSELLTDEAFN
jgi:Fe-S oxidoreductase